MNPTHPVFGMSDQFIFTRYRTDCYHCGQIADQIIKAVPYKAEVACDNCGATRSLSPVSRM